MRNVVCLGIVLVCASQVSAQKAPRAADGPQAALSVLVGRPTDRTAAVSVLSESKITAFVEYGTKSRVYGSRTPTRAIAADTPTDFELAELSPASEIFYRLNTQRDGQAGFTLGAEHCFHTCRTSGDGFTFAVQGDSHPERLGRMYDPDLYLRTLQNVAQDAPDFYFMMGDDFSIERLFEQKSLSQSAVDAIYAHQRGFLGIVGQSTPLMLVNGNHEQAAKHLLDGSAANGAVYAGKARTHFFPLPAPAVAKSEKAFYTGNAEPVEHIGLLRDYYAWEWGDALFIVIDPYWHSSVVVDNEAGAKAPSRNKGSEPPDDNRRGKGKRDLWQVTLGDTQFHWLEKTLRESHATFKFIFCHHVLGTGRGGIEEANQYEWGGQDKAGKHAEDQSQPRGFDRFFQHRPTWDKPIHPLMQETGVTIFFQGHDHLYAHQELDGVTYQTCPNPADPTFTAFNRDAYRSGDIFPNSGHLRVTVDGGKSPSVRVEYVRSLRPGDEKEGLKNNSIVHSYVITPRQQKSPDR